MEALSSSKLPFANSDRTDGAIAADDPYRQFSFTEPSLEPLRVAGNLDPADPASIGSLGFPISRSLDEEWNVGLLQRLRDSGQACRHSLAADAAYRRPKPSGDRIKIVNPDRPTEEPVASSDCCLKRHAEGRASRLIGIGES
jgi:hypothetical protein